ncbi:MAG: MEKHLA domain-containing protein [Marinobacterium sp.]|nr:MEKHLA domain-containing protein [Marinobacterium sp.]
MRVISQRPSVGDIIHEMYLNPSAISVAQAAVHCGMPVSTLAAVIAGTQPVTDQIATQLGKGLGSTPHFWHEAYQAWQQQCLAAAEHIYQPTLVTLAQQIASSYQQRLGKSLFSDNNTYPDKPYLIAEQLYQLPTVILAHDGGKDPRFTYANLTAQRLWEMDWWQLVGMPSRYSAEPDHRDSRAQLLAQVQARGYIDNYRGIRISANGQRFEIQQAVVFNLSDSDGKKVGQAATFADWQML